MATLATSTTSNNYIPTTVDLNTLIRGIETTVTLKSSGSPNTYAQGFIDGLTAAATYLQTYRDTNYTSAPPLNYPSGY